MNTDPKKLEAYILRTYGILGVSPFSLEDGPRVFRHSANRKWFAVVMDIPAHRLGIPKEENLFVVNLKCDPRLIGSFRAESGIYPGYHMNKDHWLTVVLDGCVNADSVKFLLDMSYTLTK